MPQMIDLVELQWFASSATLGADDVATVVRWRRAAIGVHTDCQRRMHAGGSDASLRQLAHPPRPRSPSAISSILSPF